MPLSYTPPQRNVHPRLFWNTAQINQAKTDIAGNGPKSGDYSKMRDWVNKAINNSNESFHNEEGDSVGALAADWVLTGNTTAANKAIDVANYLANRAFDGKTEAANDMVAMAMVYDFLWGYMSASQRTNLRTAMAAHQATKRGKTSSDEKFGWGHSPDNTFSRIQLLWAIMEDGSGSENTTWKNHFEEALDYIDNGTQDCFFGTARHFSVGEYSSPWGIHSYGENTYTRYWTRFLMAFRNTGIKDWFAEDWFKHYIDHTIWHWRGDDSFHREHEQGINSKYGKGHQLHAMLTGFAHPGTNQARRAEWLRQRMQAVRDFDIRDHAYFYYILFRNPNLQPLTPAVANMDGASGTGFRSFSKLARICVRETGGPANRTGWGNKDISVVCHAERFHSGAHQRKNLGHFTIAADAAVMSRIGWVKSSDLSYKRNTTLYFTGNQRTFANRILSMNAVSIMDAGELWKTDPRQIAFYQTGESSSVMGYVDGSGTFNGKDGDKVKYSDCGGQMWSADPSKSGHKFLPHNVTELINRWDIWGLVGATESASVFLNGPNVDAAGKFYHFSLDLKRAYPGWRTNTLREATRHFYFIRPGAIPGWDRLCFFVWDKIDADNHPSHGKKTKRIWFVNPETGQNVTGNIWRVNDKNSNPVFSAFLYLLAPTGLETTTRTGQRDLDNVEYPPDVPKSRDDNRSNGGTKPSWRLEVNPPGTGNTVSFVTFIAPCAGNTSNGSRPTVTLIDTPDDIGVQVGPAPDAVDFTINKATGNPEGGGDPFPIDTEPPSIPQNLVATPGFGLISLSWSPSPEPDTKEYTIERRQRIGPAPTQDLNLQVPVAVKVSGFDIGPQETLTAKVAIEVAGADDMPQIIPNVWITPSEIAALPTSGTPWDQVVSNAANSFSAIDLSNQNSNRDVWTLAKAYKAVRLGESTTAIESILQATINSEGTALLAVARNVPSMVIAADLIGYNNTTFKNWVASLTTKRYTDFNDDAHALMRVCMGKRPQNWGTMCGASLAAIARYLGDQALFEDTIAKLRGMLGDRTAYAGFDWRHLDKGWSHNSSAPVPINPQGATKSGQNIDGLNPEEWGRQGLSFPNIASNTDGKNYQWEFLQGLVVWMEIAYRAGYTDVWTWSNSAGRRAVDWMYSINEPAENWNDDVWQLHIWNKRTGTSRPTPSSQWRGKNMGWTAWTHA